MACLLRIAKWIRTVICVQKHERPAPPVEGVLQMLPLRLSELNDLVTIVQRKLKDVSSLLDVDGTRPRELLQFPSDLWREAAGL